MKVNQTYKATIDELFTRFSSSKDGLDESEAKKLLEKYGYNEIPEKKVNPVLKFLGYFWGPIPWMIEAAAIISAVLARWEDFWIIFTLLIINGTIAFWQEYKADNAIQLLKKKLAIKARVLRNNTWKEIPARELVPGDIIRIRLGDIIPADVKLFDGEYLLVDESALTGESLPVEKQLYDIAYSGSIVRKGEMTALVIATGINTYFGRTTILASDIKRRSHLQKAIIKIGDYLIILGISLITIIIILAFFREESILETLRFALVLLIASIPAALPTVLSVTMAIGSTMLAKKQAIVSRLVAIEEMAGMDVLCADKTGTLTKNDLTVADIKAFGKYKENDVLLLAYMASRKEDNDPIDNAIIEKVRSLNITKSFMQVSFMPFDPTSKRTEAVIDFEGKKFKVSKGAPQVILSLVKDKEKIEALVEDSINAIAAKGSRSLGVAKSDMDGNWQFVGIISFYDPPREDSKSTIEVAKNMGIKIKMITGDHLAIAKEIARQLNLGSNIKTASILEKRDKIEEVVEEADGFAQVLPEHKYSIVELLQSKGHIVGMTGDGVNDVPALKKADVGIAVEGATDAAKSAADIVLTQSGLSVIIDAVKESRKIFQRMYNYAIYRIGETIRVLLFLTASIIAFNFYPITPIMIVLLALLNDLPIITIAYDKVRYSLKPERWNMQTLLIIATTLGVIGVVSSFIILYIGMDIFGLTTELLRTFVYLKLSVAGHMFLFSARTRHYFWSIKPSIPLFIAVISTQSIATLISVYGILLPAIGWHLALFVWGYSLTAFLITDFIKVRIYNLLEKKQLKL
ncbi:MAG: plasma-membrane proton-efflux P-type ATPase [Candidatus Nitrosothermus koennekii]|nr:MAG: plasma-membrane proton-efflux P-type ATPase [Candidatus Nitrosothermus koennekii]